MEKELDYLLQTSTNDDEKAFETNEMARFAKLFGRFLQEEGPSVEWDNIQKLRTDAVKNYDTLKTPTDSNVSNNRIDHFHSGLAGVFGLCTMIYLLSDQ